MLGEAARSEADAKRYFDRYMKAIDAIGKSAGKPANAHSDLLMARPGISVKLSALHPRFEAGKEMRLAEELAPRLLTLLKAARAQALAVTIDAEEQNRLEPLLDQFAIAFTDPALEGWDGLGIAVQAYGKRAVPVLRWLRALAERSGQPHPRAPCQRGLLGQRDQMGAGARARRLPRVHAKASHRRVVSRLHAAAACLSESVLSAVRHP